MKNPLVLLALLLVNSSAFAQTLEQTFRNLLAEFKANPYAYIQANYAPSLRFIAGHNGEFRTKDRMIAPTTKVEDIQATNLKFFESSDLAVVSGINITRYAVPNGQPATYKDAFTYTFQKVSGKWKHVAMQHTKLDYNIPGQMKADEEAIKKVIETATTAVYANDIATYRKQWVDASYISRVSSSTDGTVNKMTGDDFTKAYENLAKNGKPQAVTVTRDNWLIRIHDDSAFVLFDQHNQYADGKKRDSAEGRYLEKSSNGWKIVNASIFPKK